MTLKQKSLKPPGKTAGCDSVEIMHALRSAAEISGSEHSLTRSLCLSEDLQSVCVQTESQNLQRAGGTLVKSNVCPTSESPISEN